MADSRDAFVYYRVGEQLGLHWDFSDPGATLDLCHRLGRVVSMASSRPLFSSAACANKALTQLVTNNKLEEAMNWLRALSGGVADLQDCAELLDAASAVVDYQLLAGISMEVTAVCSEGSALKALAIALRTLASGLCDFHDAPWAA